ncbi:MAG: amidohydrolase family protein [Thermodesulfobacteriota bacterium]
MKADCVIKNGIVVTPQNTIIGGVAVKGPQIVAVGADALLPEASRTIDAQGGYVIPGLIDVHYHLGAGGPFERIESDFKTETPGAALNGVTTIGSMLATLGSYIPAAAKAIEWGKGRSFVNYAFHCAIQVPAHLEEVMKLCDMGMSRFKMFYTAYKGEEGRKIGQLGCDDGLVYRACELFAEYGFPAMATLHCEEQDIMDLLQPRYENKRMDLPAWTEARPDFIEPMSLDSAAWIAKATGAAIHIAHMSTKEAVEELTRWQKAGVRIYGETTPTYLTLTKYDNIGLFGKINPPLREKEDQEALWAALRDGVITTMGTDTCPYTRQEKEQGGNLWCALPGFATGVEIFCAAMISEGVNKGRLSLEQMVKVTSEGTARLLNLYPRKGALVPGADADIVIVDPKRETTVRSKDMVTRSKEWSPFEGMKLKGLPVFTMVMGEIMAENRQLVGKPNGRFVPVKKS